MVKIFIQKCVISLDNPSVFAIRQCGHQCICEDCWTDSRVQLIKCAVCRNLVSGKTRCSLGGFSFF